MDIWRELMGAEKAQNSNSKLASMEELWPGAVSLTTTGEIALCLHMYGVSRVCRR